MRVATVSWVAGLLLLGACAGDSSTASTEVVGTPDPTSSAVDGASPSTSDTLPALLDPSIDLDAIDRPIVLWFWSPG